MEEIGLAVEAQAGIAVHNLGFQCTQGKIALDPVFSGGEGEGIEMGLIRRPKLGIFRGNQGFAIHQGIFLALQDHNAAKGRGHGDDSLSQGGLDIDLVYITCRHAFQPNTLPDAGYRGVPHAAPGQRLLAVGKGFVPQVIGNTDHQLVFFSQGIGDVQSESVVPANVGTHKDLVYINFCLLIRRADVEQHPILSEAFRKNQFFPVKQAGTFGEMLSNAGKLRFRAERNQNLPVIGSRKCPILGNRKVPGSV